MILLKPAPFLQQRSGDPEQLYRDFLEYVAIFKMFLTATNTDGAHTAAHGAEPGGGQCKGCVRALATLQLVRGWRWKSTSTMWVWWWLQTPSSGADESVWIQRYLSLSTSIWTLLLTAKPPSCCYIVQEKWLTVKDWRGCVIHDIDLGYSISAHYMRIKNYPHIHYMRISTSL